MNKRWNEIESMLLLSVSFTIFLIAFRFFYFGKPDFLFYLWNLFLAVIPLLLSRQLHKWKKLNLTASGLLLCWLLFLPNAPYIITDIFHFYERPPVPKWFDLLLVTSATWNGMMLAVVSLMQVEQFLQLNFSFLKVNIAMISIILSCAYGIYLGRFLRFNSWDVLTNTDSLLHNIAASFIYPGSHVSIWAFTMFFGTLLWLVYYTVKKLPAIIGTGG